MKKALMVMALASAVFAAPVFAADAPGQPQQTQQPAARPAPSFEEMKAGILKSIDMRQADLAEEKACVEATKSMDDLKACRESRRAKMEQSRGDMGRPDGSGMKPGGQGMPQRPNGQTPQGGMQRPMPPQGQ